MQPRGVPSMNGLLCYCRAGFEPDLAAELGERAAEAGVVGYARAERGSGYVLFLGDDEAMAKRLPWRSLVFARQSLPLFAELRGLDPKDSIAPMIHAIEAAADEDRAPRRHGTLWVEHPDSDAGKHLSGLARRFANAMRSTSRKRCLLSQAEDAALPRLHVCFLDGDHALLASADPAHSSPWPLGVPRLKLHADAPSRSALKLEEALHVLLDPAQR